MINNQEVEKIISFVKKEPRTIQDISEHIGRSWVTTESYVKRIQTETGRLFMKVFRPNTQGALKIVFIPTRDSLAFDDIKESLFDQIKTARRKEDFDFLEIFQFIKDSEKRMWKKEDQISKIFESTSEQLVIFSGNLSFIKNSYEIIEKLLKRKVIIRIICRINFATIKNLKIIELLSKKYPNQIEIRHRYQPLRGFISDGKTAFFKSDDKMSNYRQGELDHDLNLTYEIYDREWVDWILNIFWYFFRNSVEADIRLKELRK
jgi:hypothetical protein